MDLVFKSILLFCFFGLSTSRSVTLEDDIPTCDNSFKIISSYPSGYVAILHLVSESEVDGWSAEMTMDHEFNELTVNESTDLKCSGMICTFKNIYSNRKIFPGETKNVGFEVQFNMGQHPRPMLSNLKLNGNVICDSP